MDRRGQPAPRWRAGVFSRPDRRGTGGPSRAARERQQARRRLAERNPSEGRRRQTGQLDLHGHLSGPAGRRPQRRGGGSHAYRGLWSPAVGARRHRSSDRFRWFKPAHHQRQWMEGRRGRGPGLARPGVRRSRLGGRCRSDVQTNRRAVAQISCDTPKARASPGPANSQRAPLCDGARMLRGLDQRPARRRPTDGAGIHRHLQARPLSGLRRHPSAQGRRQRSRSLGW